MATLKSLNDLEAEILGLVENIKNNLEKQNQAVKVETQQKIVEMTKTVESFNSTAEQYKKDFKAQIDSIPKTIKTQVDSNLQAVRDNHNNLQAQVNGLDKKVSVIETNQTKTQNKIKVIIKILGE